MHTRRNTPETHRKRGNKARGLGGHGAGGGARKAEKARNEGGEKRDGVGGVAREGEMRRVSEKSEKKESERAKGGGPLGGTVSRKTSREPPPHQRYRDETGRSQPSHPRGRVNPRWENNSEWHFQTAKSPPCPPGKLLLIPQNPAPALPAW